MRKKKTKIKNSRVTDNIVVPLGNLFDIFTGCFDGYSMITNCSMVDSYHIKTKRLKNKVIIEITPLVK